MTNKRNTKTLVFIVSMIAWSLIGKGQQSFFLDSLFEYDLSKIIAIDNEYQNSQIEKLGNDWGLSAGLSITNSYQEEIDAGLSTRLYIRANFLSGGYYENLKERDIINYQMKVDSIQGNDRAIAHNYGIYYDYIIYKYNVEKLTIIDDLLVENQKVEDLFERLYYNKLIDYSEIIDIKDITNQYSLLKESAIDYNMIFQEMIVDTILPNMYTHQSWNVDFSGICQMIHTDSSYRKVIDIQNEIQDINYDKENVPSVSLSAGYDMSRKRPFFAFGVNKKISTKKRQHLESKKRTNINNHRLENIQKKKEILNIQYEYRYKEKQLNGLYSKIDKIDEELRKYSVKREVLSLEGGIQERKLNIDRLMSEYEIIDLKGQMMLLLLSLKRRIPKLEIGPYIKSKSRKNNYKKFAGNRYIQQQENTKLSSYDRLFLAQNEISLITASEIIELQNVALIDPSESQTRAQLEEKILTLINNEQKENFIIKDIASFKKLEINTIAQREYALTDFDD